MKFNAEKTEKVIYSAKRVKAFHPPLSFGNDDVVRKSEHKHLGMILDSKLDFQSHIKGARQNARRGIGMIRYLSKYVSRDILDQIYKLYVRPHFDYGLLFIMAKLRTRTAKDHAQSLCALPPGAIEHKCTERGKIQKNSMFV